MLAGSSNFLPMFSAHTFDNSIFICNGNLQQNFAQIDTLAAGKSIETPPSLNDNGNGSKKYVNPFDPEATVPLPLELEDQFGPYSSSVWKRNERERCRVRNVNDGYERLRKHLPVRMEKAHIVSTTIFLFKATTNTNISREKRISKVDTLRLAIRYIRHLDNLLKNHLHQHNCKCFVGFQEESEGNIAIDIDSFSFSNNLLINGSLYK
uniref:BHLH domain-containing protein n=1 Tax=Caenorhabditis japonica TaxID=281687 RepID=A0A8R1E982_CAEJA